MLCFIFAPKIAAQDVLSEFCKSEDIKTILFYGISASDDWRNKYINTPIINIKAKQKLVLEFDDLRAKHSSFRVKLIHCDLEWKQSRLSDMQYLKDLNEYNINDFQVSQGTKIPYYHFRFIVPGLKISGNYILQVFEGFDSAEPIIQRRFWIYDQKIGIETQPKAAQDPEYWRTHQQVNFSINTSAYFINFPQKELKIVVRQNQRDEYTKTLNNDALVRKNANELTYKYFNAEPLFKAGNEYRYVDISSTFRKNQLIDKIELGEPSTVYTTVQKSRSRLNYTSNYDNNGSFIINALDGINADIEADYVNLVSYFDSGKYEEVPYINGKMIDWKAQKMEFNPNLRVYESRHLLKQGIYDIMYESKDESINYEGDFSDTVNLYEIFIYQQVAGKAYPELIAYSRSNSL